MEIGQSNCSIDDRGTTMDHVTICHWSGAMTIKHNVYILRNHLSMDGNDHSGHSTCKLVTITSSMC